MKTMNKQPGLGGLLKHGLKAAKELQGAARELSRLSPGSVRKIEGKSFEGGGRTAAAQPKGLKLIIGRPQKNWEQATAEHGYRELTPKGGEKSGVGGGKRLRVMLGPIHKNWEHATAENGFTELKGWSGEGGKDGPRLRIMVGKPRLNWEGVFEMNNQIPLQKIKAHIGMPAVLQRTARDEPAAVIPKGLVAQRAAELKDFIGVKAQEQRDRMQNKDMKTVDKAPPGLGGLLKHGLKAAKELQGAASELSRLSPGSAAAAQPKGLNREEVPEMNDQNHLQKVRAHIGMRAFLQRTARDEPAAVIPKGLVAQRAAELKDFIGVKAQRNNWSSANGTSMALVKPHG